jgi:carbonic anhydrase/acetyltransferase-like protein (isoleucine patch superfamily)
MIYNFENSTPTLHKDSWVASNAILIGKVILKKDANVWFNVVLRGDIEPIIIGEGSNVQDGSVLHTDPGCPIKLGKSITVGHMVMLHGCEIDDDTLIGIGSTILNKTKIGKNCIIGANTLISENKIIPDRSLVLGSPGKVIRQVTDKEIEEIKKNASRYVENYKRYKNSKLFYS